MEEGYVTFVNDNKNYLQLLDILVESVLVFSSKKIEIFSINCDYSHSNIRVINHRINLSNPNFENICYTKLYSSYNSVFDYGIQLDSDFIITKDMDNLFHDCKKIKEFPLGSRHPSDPNNQHQLMNYLGVKEKTQPYIHATYLFSKNCKNFIRECFELSNDLQKKNITPPNYDETILNTMLWKHNANEFVTTYDPYFDFFLNRSDENKKFHGYNDLPINFYSCHAQKNPVAARIILEDLIKKNI